MTGNQSRFRAFAVVGLYLALSGQALATPYKQTTLVNRLWYSAGAVVEYLAKNHPSLVNGSFHKSVTYGFSERSAPTVSKDYAYRAFPLSSRENNSRPRDKSEGPIQEAEVNDQCMVLVTSALLQLRIQVKDELRRTGAQARKVVIPGVRTGELALAPADLTSTRDRPIAPIPAEGRGDVLCNVYRSVIRDSKVTYVFSVTLTAPGFYYQR